MTKTVTLGEICDILSGFAFDSERFNDSKGMPLIRIRDVGKNQTDTFYSGPYSERYIIEQGDMLIGMDGDFRIAEWRSVPALLNQRVCKLEPNISRIDAKFLLHFLPKKLKQIEDATSFATVKHLSVKGIQAIEIPLPPLPEQRRIAALLDHADALRQKDRQLLAHYDKLAQSVFLDLFGDPVKNEKGWVFKSIEQLITDGPQNGLYKPSSAYGTGTPILRIDSFYDGSISNIELLKRVRVEDKELRMFQIYEDNIVINRVNSPSHLGKSALIPKLLEPTVFESNMMRLEINQSWVNPSYLIKILCHDFVKKQILERSKDAVNQSSINQQDVKSFVVPVPPLPLQTHFANVIEKIEKQKAVVRQQMAASEGLFGRLLQESFP